MGLLTFLKVIVVLAILIAGYMYYLGYWDPQEARKVSLDGFPFMYFEAQCEYKDLGKLFTRLEKDIETDFDEEEYAFAGCYFDGPEMLKESHMTRSAIGIIPLNEQALAKCERFVRKAPRYQLIHLPSVSYKPISPSYFFR